MRNGLRLKLRLEEKNQLRGQGNIISIVLSGGDGDRIGAVIMRMGRMKTLRDG